LNDYNELLILEVSVLGVLLKKKTKKSPGTDKSWGRLWGRNGFGYRAFSESEFPKVKTS
jgi:hypothetical protein